MERYQDINARTIDSWIAEGWEWGQPISHEIYEKALAGDWDVVLTPLKAVPHEWFGHLKGKRVLGLASGGGQQMPVFAALGAECTVLDYSEKQLESERMVAAREGYDIRVIRADMTQPLPFADGEFDLIFHPVSNCYVREVEGIWRECHRVLREGGALLAGFSNSFVYALDNDERTVVNTLPFDPVANPEQMKQLEAEDCGVQFSHTLEEQIGGQLRAGFTITDIYEDYDTEGGLCEHHVPGYIATRAVKGAALTAGAYQREAMTMLNPAIPPEDVLLNAVMGLCGEAGEAIDLVKKQRFQGHPLDRDALIKELGDAAWYLAEAAQGLGVLLEEILRRNLDKLRRRYPAGFSVEGSMRREEQT